MVVSLDEQFTRNLDAKKEANVQLIMDGRRSNTTQILFGYASNIITQFNNDFATKTNIHMQQSALIPRNWFNPNLLYYWYNIPCLCGILSMITSLMVTALSIARERELGTFDQLLVSPMMPIEILIGKAIPAIVIGVLEGTVILLVGTLIFQVPFTGFLTTLYFSLLVFICSIVGVGLFLSSLCATQQQAILGTFIFLTPCILLSGFATPIENMPVWMQYGTYINPLKYFIIIAKGTFLKAMPIHIVLNNVWQMALIAVFTLTASTWFFRSRLQ